MKKVKGKAIDELRPEYKRSDFRMLVRGKYAQRVAEASNVVVLDPEVAKAFPNDQAVNRALRKVIGTRRSSAQVTPRTRPARRTPARRPAHERSTPSR
jgi:hypothetical protein